jgi:malate synthase
MSASRSTIHQKTLAVLAKVFRCIRSPIHAPRSSLRMVISAEAEITVVAARVVIRESWEAANPQNEGLLDCGLILSATKAHFVRRESTRRDKAEALRLYQRQQGDSQRAQNAAAVIKIRAERRMGELLREMPKHEGGRPEKTRSVVEPVSTLSDLGIDRHVSHRGQAIAAVPEEEFEATLAEAVERLR